MITNWATMVRGLLSRIPFTRRQLSSHARRRRPTWTPTCAAIEIMEPRTLLSANVQSVSGGWLITDNAAPAADILTLTFNTSTATFALADNQGGITGVSGPYNDATNN